jgi:putative membrane protein
MYLYLKALHIIFVVTWFAGLFYMPRLFIYATEAETKDDMARTALQNQFKVMMKRLWYGITWPSAILTLCFGGSVMFGGGWHRIIWQEQGRWLLIKLIFVLILYVYHISIHLIYKQIQKNKFRYSSMQLRIWNEVATVFLVAIVTLAVVKESTSWAWSVVGLMSFILMLFFAIKIYKLLRN